jgi:hypothetical protein
VGGAAVDAAAGLAFAGAAGWVAGAGRDAPLTMTLPRISLSVAGPMPGTFSRSSMDLKKPFF